LLSYYSGSTF
nr:immunoglobulin light chain junction region [Macaca mulatta]